MGSYGFCYQDLYNYVLWEFIRGTGQTVLLTSQAPPVDPRFYLSLMRLVCYRYGNDPGFDLGLVGGRILTKSPDSVGSTMKASISETWQCRGSPKKTGTAG